MLAKKPGRQPVLQVVQWKPWHKYVFSSFMCSACFCSLLWVHEEAFAFLCRLLGLIYIHACLLVGRSEVKRNTYGGRYFCRSQNTSDFPGLQVSWVVVHRTGQGQGYLAALMLAPLMQVGLQRTLCLPAPCQLELLGPRRLQQATHQGLRS